MLRISHRARSTSKDKLTTGNGNSMPEVQAAAPAKALEFRSPCAQVAGFRRVAIVACSLFGVYDAAFHDQGWGLRELWFGVLPATATRCRKY